MTIFSQVKITDEHVNRWVSGNSYF